MNFIDVFLKEKEAPPLIFLENKIRRRSEIFIFNNEGKICVGTNKKKNGDTCYTFPGGGLNINETEIMAAKREALEEVGVLAKDISPISTSLTILWKDLYKDEKNIPKSLPRNSIGQDGMITSFFIGKFDKYNYDLYGDDGDQGKCVWMYIQHHIDRIKRDIKECTQEKLWLKKWWEKELSILTEFKNLGIYEDVA